MWLQEKVAGYPNPNLKVNSNWVLYGPNNLTYNIKLTYHYCHPCLLSSPAAADLSPATAGRRRPPPAAAR